jgi:PadR family transcriptional regulator PadR
MAASQPNLTPQMVSVLEVMLVEPTEPWHGFELCKAAQLKSGTVYPLLVRLERAGWLESEWENVNPAEVGRPRRRLYRLTGPGEVNARHAIDQLLAELHRAQAVARRPRLRERPA